MDELASQQGLYQGEEEGKYLCRAVDRFGKTITIGKRKYLNNIVEQDDRGVERITIPMLGFKLVDAAQSALISFELIRMLRKDQLEGDEMKSLTVAE